MPFIKDPSKKIEVAANLAIIVTSILIGVVAVRNYIVTKPASTDAAHVATNDQTQLGRKLSLPDVDWQKNGQTLLLALSSTCHFCTESAPFYKRLAQERGNTRLIAVMPQNAKDGERYLHELGVAVDEVKQTQFDLLQIKGTPTLILVNSEGVVTNSWIGKLPDNLEIEVLSRLQNEF
jgi:thiol-disulfide isomerase/thioredoxin